MDHVNIENEFIIEKFIAGELDKEPRRLFFEHALQCPVCRKRVFLAGKVDEAMLTAKKGWKKQIVTEPTKRRLIITYSAVAALIIFAFIGGYFLNNRETINEPQVADKTENPVEDKVDTSSTKEKKIENIKSLKKPDQIAIKPENKSEKQNFESKEPTELLAMADAGYNLNSASKLLNIDAGVHTKGINDSEIDKGKVLRTIADQSSIFNQYIDIEKPVSGEVLRANQPFRGRWQFQNSNSAATVIIINQKKQEVVCSYRDIKDSELTFRDGLPKGQYYMVIYEQGTRNWHAVDFEVR